MKSFASLSISPVQEETSHGRTKLKILKKLMCSEFLYSCHSQYSNNLYSVFKDKSVRYKWSGELDPYIRDKIYKEIRNTRLEQFIK